MQSDIPKTPPPPSIAPGPPLKRFQAWLRDSRGFDRRTAYAVSARARWAFTKLGWDPDLAPDESAQRLGTYLLILPKSWHSIFRHAWRLYGAFATTFGKTVPELAGGRDEHDDTVRKELVEGVVGLLAVLYTHEMVKGRRRLFRCRDVVLLRWEHLHCPPALLPAEARCWMDLGDNRVDLPQRHLQHTFRAILAWSQPWANVLRRETIQPGPLVTGVVGGDNPMGATALQQLLGRFGYPVTAKAILSWQEAERFRQGRAFDQQTVELEAKHEALRLEAEKLAEPGALEALWSTRHPHAPRTVVGDEDAALLGHVAMMAANIRRHRAFDRVLAEEIAEPGAHAGQLAAAIRVERRGRVENLAPPLVMPKINTQVESAAAAVREEIAAAARDPHSSKSPLDGLLSSAPPLFSWPDKDGAGD